MRALVRLCSCLRDQGERHARRFVEMWMGQSLQNAWRGWCAVLQGARLRRLRVSRFMALRRLRTLSRTHRGLIDNVIEERRQRRLIARVRARWTNVRLLKVSERYFLRSLGSSEKGGRGGHTVGRGRSIECDAPASDVQSLNRAARKEEGSSRQSGASKPRCHVRLPPLASLREMHGPFLPMRCHTTHAPAPVLHAGNGAPRHSRRGRRTCTSAYASATY